MENQDRSSFTGRTIHSAGRMAPEVASREPFESELVFAETYECHRAGLLDYLRRCTRDTASAEDLVHEAFARLLTELRAGRRPRDPGAWLRRVGRNLYISQTRRARVAERHAPRLLEAGGQDPTMRGVLERESVATLRTALQRVPDTQRQLLLLAASGLTPVEMGVLVGASGGAVRTRLHRARRQLIGQLKTLDATV
jgi:RNA polymerase sigma-70 factor (ECF subfamily)